MGWDNIIKADEHDYKFTIMIRSQSKVASRVKSVIREQITHPLAVQTGQVASVSISLILK